MKPKEKNFLLCWQRAANLLMISLVGLAGCVMTGGGVHFRVTPVAEDDVILEMSAQGPMLISTKSNMAISVQPLSPLWVSNERPGFHLYVANLSDYGFRFGTDNIRAVYNGQKLRVVSPEVLVVEARKKQQEAANQAATVSFLTQLSDYLSTYEQHDSYDSYARAQRQAQIINMSVQDSVQQEIDASKQAALTEQDYQRNMLKEQVIRAKGRGDRQNVGGGVFYVDIPSSMDQGGYFEILIDVGGEYHDFRFQTQRVDA